MKARLALASSLIALLLAACGDPDPAAGAAKVELRWQDFQPGCLLLVASSGELTADPILFPLSGDQRSGTRTVAVYRGEGWGSDLTLTARATEGSCAGGKVVAEQTAEVRITRGVITPDPIVLTAPDLDQDGYVDANAPRPGSDCNDQNPERRPGATEQCNGADDNCDGQADEGVGTTYYADQDGDTFGAAASALIACAQPVGYVASAGDCDDTAATVNPSAAEACNGVDDDCDAVIDEELPSNTYYRDADGDGHGDLAQPLTACQLPKGYSETSDDCSDADPQRFPGNPEQCDLKDNDCDTEVDEGATTTFYVDEDGDDYGGTASVQACTAPAGYTDQGGDCDDTPVKGATINPGASEVCNGVDDDCDKAIDEGVQTTFYLDADLDSYGTPTSTQQACTAPSGYVANNQDCNDGNGAVKPGATESCNGLDDDCDTQIDEGVTTSYWRDEDGDGEGDLQGVIQACSAGPGAVANSSDCDDGNRFRYSGATEVCDLLDNDCDTAVDEGLDCTTHGWKTPNDTWSADHDFKTAAPYARNKAYAVGHKDGNNNPKVRRYEGLVLTADWDGGHCGGPHRSAWADPAALSSGNLYTGRDNSVTWHTASGADCSNPSGGTVNTSGGAGFHGLVGLRNSGGDLWLYTADSGGKVFFWWAGWAAPFEIASTTARFFEIAGHDPNQLVAVGSDDAGTPRPLIFERRGSSTFQVATLPSAGIPTGALELRDVSVAPSGHVMAVGDQGLVLARTPTGNWTVLPVPPTATALTGVKLFGASLAYAVGAAVDGGGSASHEIWRWNGAAWTKLGNTNLPSTSAPRDIDGTAPDDLWVVGDNGLVRHWNP